MDGNGEDGEGFTDMALLFFYAERPVGICQVRGSHSRQEKRCASRHSEGKSRVLESIFVFWCVRLPR